MLLCNFFLKCNKKMFTNKQYSILEILLIVSVIVGFFIHIYDYDSICLVLALTIILVLTINRGFISIILSRSKILNKFGNLNLEFYLFHQPIIKYYEFFFSKIDIPNKLISILIVLIIFFNLYFVSNFINKYLKLKKVNQKSY